MADLSDVMDDLGAALDTIEGLRVYPYWAGRVVPPAAVVGLPDDCQFDSVLQRGADRLRLPIVVAVGKADARSTRDRLAKYAAGSGPVSVKAVVEAHESAAWDSARVESVEFGTATIAGTECLAATFMIDVSVRGD